MIDIYHFLNSTDVADHLREIGYKFTAPEAAFIVHQSRDATLNEKIAAWLEIAETMPDCSMDERLNMDPIPSFRQFLHDYVGLKKRELARFFDANGFVYTHSYYGKGFVWQDEGTCFDTAEGCLEYMKSYWNDPNDPILGFRLNKMPLNSPGFKPAVFLHWLHEICEDSADCDFNHHSNREEPDIADPQRDDWLYLNAEFEVLEVDCVMESAEDMDLDLQFYGMWFALPTPFKRGDILIDATSLYREPFVLDSLPTWGKKGCLENGFAENDRYTERADWVLEHLSETGDTSDMDGNGFFRASSGEIYRDTTCCSYLDLEYHRDELAASDRWAAVVSAHLKRKVDFLECHNLLNYVRIDSESQQLHKHYDGFYPEQYYPDGVWQKIRGDRKRAE